MENTKNITKITFDYTPYHNRQDGAILTITSKSISCEYKDNSPRSFDWSYNSNSHEFSCIFIEIAELMKKHFEPTPEKNQADKYEISITYDDNSNATVKHSTSYMMFEDVFGELHKLIPPLEEIPLGFDTNETAEKRVEDLWGDTENPVLFEDIYGDDPDN